VTTIDLPAITTVRTVARRSHRAPAAAAVETTVVGERPSMVQRLISLLGTLLLILAVVAVLFLAIGPRFFGYQTATMLTGSMSPGIDPGDVVVTTVQPVSEVAVGDIISYHIPVEDHRVETHRVIEVIHGEDGSTAVRTKGDANQSEDPWIATLEGNHLYEAKAVIPGVGNVIRALRTPTVSHILVYGVPTVLVGGLLMMIWRRPEDTDAAPTAVSGGGSATSATGPESTRPPATARTDMSQLPVLDQQILDDLGAELASRAGAHRFAATFGDMLPERIDGVEAAFGSGDTDAALVAILSLNVSSSMVGARRLEEFSSAALELADEPSAHAGLIRRLRTLGAEFQSELGGIIR
jgi:signal peptidase I